MKRVIMAGLITLAFMVGCRPNPPDMYLDQEGNWSAVTSDALIKEKKDQIKPSRSKTETVFVTEGGGKYHLPDCSYAVDGREISLEEAELRGYEPCSRCCKGVNTRN